MLRLSQPGKIAIVAALEREVGPLVRGWPVTHREHDGRRFKFFENADTVLVCGGIGGTAARRAAEAIIELYKPAMVVSAGFAGGLDSSLRVGDALIPKQVVDARDGSRIECPSGHGVLVSFEHVADVQQKKELSRAFAARAVDMEAAGVARSAEAHGLKFVAYKVISDASETTLPPVDRFVETDGQFKTSSFMVYAAFRPWLWASLARLSRNSSIAAQRLCQLLSEALLAIDRQEDGSLLIESKF